MDPKVDFNASKKKYILVDEEKYYHMENALKVIVEIDNLKRGKAKSISLDEYKKLVRDGKI